MDMANQQDDRDEERNHNIELLVEQLRQAETRALLKRGIELWVGTERAVLGGGALPAAKIN